MPRAKVAPVHAATSKTSDRDAAFEFDVTTDLNTSLALAIRWGGLEILIPSRPIETPSFQFAMLKLCLSGSGTYETPTQRIDLQAGHVFWSGFHQPTLLTVPKTGMVNYAVALFGRDCTSFYDRHLHSQVGALKLREIAPIESTYEMIMQEGRGNADNREEVSALLAEVLLRRIDAQSDTPLATHTLARSTFKRCRSYVEQNFATISSLRVVAEACEVTVPYLCRLFDQFFDCGPYEYMTRLKMNRAESLLLRPTMPISEVAAAVGYKDPRLFARNFKVAFGKTPTKYRTALMPQD